MYYIHATLVLLSISEALNPTEGRLLNELMKKTPGDWSATTTPAVQNLMDEPAIRAEALGTDQMPCFELVDKNFEKFMSCVGLSFIIQKGKYCFLFTRPYCNVFHAFLNEFLLSSRETSSLGMQDLR